MELQQALENIKHVRYKFAKDEIICIREHKEEVIPTLIQYVKAVTDYGDNIPEDYEAYLYAMFLLAEFKVNAAFPYLLKYLEYDIDTIDWLLDDLLFDNFCSILASCATASDIPAIKNLAENPELCWEVRSVAVSALLVLYVEGVYPHEELCDYLGYMLKTYGEDEEFISIVVCDALDVYASEHFDLMRTFFKNGMLGNKMMYIDEFEQGIAEGEMAALKMLKKTSHHHYITDTVKSMEWWASFKEKPDFGYKVGRNEPCPCGSGKKYKKCCGA